MGLPYPVSASAVMGICTERAKFLQWLAFSDNPIMPASGTPKSALETAAPLVAAVLKPAASTSLTL